MSRKLRTSVVGHPSAILFLLISSEGVFQQPQAIGLTTEVNESNGDVTTTICDATDGDRGWLQKL